MNASVQRLGYLRIDRSTESGQAAERSLHMAAGAAKPVVKVQVAEGGIEVIEPHQAHHAAAEPDAFRISCWPVDGLRGFHEFVGLALTVLGGIRCRRLLGGLVLRAGIPALGDRTANAYQQGKAGRGDALKECRTKPVKNATHEVPN